MKKLKLHGVPGGGKTQTLLGLFEHELKTVPPNRIAFLTFTRSARAEALSRASLAEDELPYVKTIHSTCYRALRLDHAQLVLSRDLREFGQKLGVHLSGYMPDLFSLEAITDKYQQPTKADRLLQLNHLGRHRGLKLKETLRDAPAELDFHYAVWFTKAYRDWKDSNGKYDYTDLLTSYLEGGKPLDIDVLFVDEGQDLSWLQWQVIHKFAANCARVYICGDPDQAIFTWAGASASMFDLEPADETRALSHSYRLPRVVHALSQRVINRIKVRFKKEFTCKSEDGEYKPVGRLGRSHVDGETLVLYRNYHRGQALAQQLIELGVGFTGGAAPLSVSEVLPACMAWRNHEKNEPISSTNLRSLLRFAHPAYILSGAKERAAVKDGVASLSESLTPGALLEPWYRVLTRLPELGYLKLAAPNGVQDLLSTRVKLMSIHQSKGSEADTVIVDTELARRTYEAYLQNPDDEARVYYVALTRSKNRLYTLLPTDSLVYPVD